MLDDETTIKITGLISILIIGIISYFPPEYLVYDIIRLFLASLLFLGVLPLWLIGWIICEGLLKIQNQDEQMFASGLIIFLAGMIVLSLTIFSPNIIYWSNYFTDKNPTERQLSQVLGTRVFLSEYPHYEETTERFIEKFPLVTIAKLKQIAVKSGDPDKIYNIVTITKKPFPEGEQILLKDSEVSFWYAWTLGIRFPAAEQSFVGKKWETDYAELINNYYSGNEIQEFIDELPKEIKKDVSKDPNHVPKYYRRFDRIKNCR